MACELCTPEVLRHFDKVSNLGNFEALYWGLQQLWSTSDALGACVYKWYDWYRVV
jgi:hypothetical protein